MSENSLRSALAERITQYLSNGGFFNPEHMEHDKVRALLMDCRDALAATQEPQPPQTDGIEGMLTAAIVLAEVGEIPAKVTIQRWRAALFAAAGAPAAPKGNSFERWWAEEWVGDDAFSFNSQVEALAKTVAEAAWGAALGYVAPAASGREELECGCVVPEGEECKHDDQDDLDVR